MSYIYPKLIARARLRPKRKYCFVLMPFSSEFNEIYGEIKQALAEIGFECSRADDLSRNRPIMTNIVTEIIRAHFVIADLSGRNPNVFYEVGVAHALRDLTNVILLTQNIEEVPFDLRPLPIIQYWPDNRRHLAATIQRAVNSNKHFFEGQLKLRDRYLYTLANEYELEEITEFISNRESDLWALILPVLELEGVNRQEESTVSLSLFYLRSEMAKLLRQERIRLFNNLSHLFVDILCFYSYAADIEAYVTAALREKKFPDFELGARDSERLLILLATRVFRQPKLKRLSMDWLFGYLSNPKVAGVDLNRATVESFLMTSKDPEVRENIVLCLSHDHDLIRESACDFVGELRIEEALPQLRHLLEREGNYYVVRSAFSALGKIAAEEGGDLIIKWFRCNLSVFRERQLSFVVTHGYSALERIDRKMGTALAADLRLLQLSLSQNSE